MTQRQIKPYSAALSNFGRYSPRSAFQIYERPQWHTHLNSSSSLTSSLVDKFIDLANQLAEGGQDGEVSAAILFAAGRYNTFNFLSNNGAEDD
jgi:hypothetical protein